MLSNSVGQIQAGSIGIVTYFGAASNKVLQPGLFVIPPFISNVFVMDLQTRAVTLASAEAASNDLQTVHTDMVLNYHLDPDPQSLIRVYSTLRDGYSARLIEPISLDTLKAVAAHYTAQNLIDRRDAVNHDLTGALTDRLGRFGIIVDNVSLTQFAFSDQFNNAIEAKVTQEQQALQAKAKLDQVTYEAKQTVTKAQAEADALRMQRQVLTPELLRLRQIEVQSKLVDKWDGKMPLMLGSGGLLSLPNSIVAPNGGEVSSGDPKATP